MNRLRLLLALVYLTQPLWPTGALAATGTPGEEEADPAEIAIGERLFLETRFAEFFFRNGGHDVNAPLATGDPVLDSTRTAGGTLPGPFAGQSMNCRACHLVDEQLGEAGGGMRTYTDFARRSPVPEREDGLATAPRNSPPLVNASLPRRGGVILHFDGEFPSLEALVLGTLTGRNYGWLPGEATTAKQHIARVVREDDGSGELAREFGGPYSRVLTGTDPTLPDGLRLPASFRVDVATASDTEIVAAVAKLIAAYTRGLVFAQDEAGRFSGSPYDRFLVENGLPAAPTAGESGEDYTERLRRSLAHLADPVFVSDGDFVHHEQRFAFGPEELRGLRIFLSPSSHASHGHPRGPRRFGRESGGRTAGFGGFGTFETGAGNCAACHPAPTFTDFGFHNTGISQMEYDAVHGAGAFQALTVPDLRTRRADADRWLPATSRHPHAREPFRRVPTRDEPAWTDLGVWNIFANRDFPGPQRRLRRALCRDVRRTGPAHRHRRLRRGRGRGRKACRRASLLEASLARFKTPGLRDLGHSAPYMHNGAFDEIEDVLRFYAEAAHLARRGRLRNADERLLPIRLSTGDIADLGRFLRALNEDYE